MDSTTINVSLELRLEEGRLSGRATDQVGASREFDGWLGLIGAIDAVVGTDAGATTANDTDDEETIRAHR